MNSFRKLSKPVAVVLTICMLSGCASSPDGQQTQAQGAGAGAIVGGLLGAALGYAAGGAEGAARGAAAGAAIGAVQGFAYGSHVAAKKEAYANTEDYLDACINSARKYNERAQAYNQNLNTRIAALERRSRAAIASRNKAEIGKIHTEIASLRSQGQDVYNTTNEEVSAQKGALNDAGVRSSGKSAALQSEVSTLEQNKAQLGKNLSHLASLENETNI